MHLRHRGVYAVGHEAEPPHAWEFAALLACGERALLSHSSAARLWALLTPPALPPTPTVEVTLVGAQCRRRLRLTTHRTRALDPADILVRHGLRLTSPARTSLDLTPRLTDRELERMLDDALARRLLSPKRLLETLARAPRRPGAARIRALVDSGRTPALTRSEAEERLLALVRRARLPHPRVNARVAGYEVDFLWPAERLAVEVDGYAFHSSRGSFERDHRRDLDLRANGLSVLRLTWRQLAEETELVLVRLAQALAAGPGRAAG